MSSPPPVPAPSPGPRSPPTVRALDARLSAWGQAARDAVERRAEVLVEAAVLHVERVGRRAEQVQVAPVDPGAALLDADVPALVPLAASLLPAAVQRSCRLLWVDPERLAGNLRAALEPHVEAARAEVRRRQALHRRRARLWAHDPARLERLREVLEGLRVPRVGEGARERVADLLAERMAPEVPRAASPRLAG